MKTSKKVLLTAAAFAGILNMNGCVYGPPPEEMFSAAYEEYDPSDNENQNVYGPPPADIIETEEYDPAKNTVPPVYGPPIDPAIEETAEEQP